MERIGVLAKEHRVCTLVLLLGAAAWFGLHVPVMFYGTADTPLHVSYWTADEQSGLNGALHVLKEKSLLGLRNETVLYYGPMMGVFGIPAVVADAGIQFLQGNVSTPESYRDAVIWDWGGILMWGRLVAAFVGFLGLIAVFQLFTTQTINPTKARWVPYLAAVTMGTSYLYFEYSGFFRHWIFIVVALLWQLYFAVRVVEVETVKWWHWATHVALALVGFGTSYLAVVYQLFWLPIFYKWFREKEWQKLKGFVAHGIAMVAGMALIIVWHPYAFFRLFALTGLSDSGTTTADLDYGGVLGVGFTFYAELMLVALWPLLLLLVVLAVYMYREGKQMWTTYLVPMLLVPAVANYLLFSTPELSVTRYVFPTITLLILLVMVLVSRHVVSLHRGHLMRRVTFVILGVFVLLNVVHTVGWLRMVSAGPVERSIIIPQIHEWQEVNPLAKILVVKSWPIGYVHTKSAYHYFVEYANKGEYELWQHILDIELPEGIEPINVEYRYAHQGLQDEDFQKYSHIVIHHPPELPEAVTELSPPDVFDIKPWTVWQYEKYQERFEIVK
jgi:hypothetical protein